METLTIRIDSLSFGGNGVGRHEGIVYFIPFSVPGDLLEISVTRKEKRYREGEIIRIIEASPHRIDPPCPFSGSCGGCQWQQVDYSLQLENKEKELRTALQKAKLTDVSDRIKPIIPSPKQLGYRRTARFKIGRGEHGQAVPGFYRAGSRDLIEIDRCMLLDERINAFLKQTKMDTPGLTGFDLFLDDDGEVRPFYRFSERDPGADFVQVNSAVNNAMTEYLGRTIRKIDSAGNGKSEKLRLLDIYCGDGNLSLQFADIADSITGWDNSKPAVLRGRASAERLKAQYPACRIRFFEADVSCSWKKIAGYASHTDCAILDPPRRGLKNQTARLAGLKIPLIVYISCSPPALVRDLAAFEKAGYRLEELQPFDMFPQTWHMETIAVLVRK